MHFVFIVFLCFQLHSDKLYDLESVTLEAENMSDQLKHDLRDVDLPLLEEQLYAMRDLYNRYVSILLSQVVGSGGIQIF